MHQERIEVLKSIIKSDYGNIAGLIVQKDGMKLYEGYFNEYESNNAVHMFSVTKSVIALLIGIAIDKGSIGSVDQKVLSFFPDYTVPAGEKALQSIAIKHLLTMTAPYKFEEEPHADFFANDNWAKAALGFLGGEAPTGEFRYTPIIGPDILSGILVNATGQSVSAFAAENLFSPLGIDIPENVVLPNEKEHIAWSMKDKHTSNAWVVDGQGVNTAGWGLALSPLDMAKIGQLYLNGGVWDGRQIISAEWISESTRIQSRWERMNLSYGYLWWVIDDKEHAYAAMGDGGNIIYVNTQKKIVVSIASLFMPNAADRMELINKHILPLFCGE